jgi:hypothetical protein
MQTAVSQLLRFRSEPPLASGYFIYIIYCFAGVLDATLLPSQHGLNIVWNSPETPWLIFLDPPQLSPLPRLGNKNMNGTRISISILVRSCSFSMWSVFRFAVVDKIIIKNVSPSYQYYSADVIKSVVSSIEAEVVDKKMASYYERTTATFCIKAVSLLALKAPNLLWWSQSQRVWLCHSWTSPTRRKPVERVWLEKYF